MAKLDVPTQLAALLGYNIKRIRITDEKPPRISFIDFAAALANHAAQDVGYVNDYLPEVTPILGDFDSAGKARKRRLWQIPVEFTFLSPGRHAAPIPFVAFLPPSCRLLSPSCRFFDLDNSFGICYRRVSLAPAREFEVKANCFNFGVSSGDATEIL